ncbi:unnamed protein product [Peronospora effusa]|nr:unnamed protein product [Peronospora effusa]
MGTKELDALQLIQMFSGINDGLVADVRHPGEPGLQQLNNNYWIIVFSTRSCPVQLGRSPPSLVPPATAANAQAVETASAVSGLTVTRATRSSRKSGHLGDRERNTRTEDRIIAAVTSHQQLSAAHDNSRVQHGRTIGAEAARGEAVPTPRARTKTTRHDKKKKHRVPSQNSATTAAARYKQTMAVIEEFMGDIDKSDSEDSEPEVEEGLRERKVEHNSSPEDDVMDGGSALSSASAVALGNSDGHVV